jgi:hypothetical protein
MGRPRRNDFPPHRCVAGDSAAAEKLLAQYIDRKHKPEPSGAPMIADVLRVYAEEVAPGMKSARNIAYQIGNLLKWWGDKTAAQITMNSCKEYCAKRPSQAAGADLKILKAATDYWHKSEYGPLNFVPVFWKPKSNLPKERWLTKPEAARLLKAAKPYPHLRRAIVDTLPAAQMAQDLAAQLYGWGALFAVL